MQKNNFYEQYWEDPSKAPPSRDPLNSRRIEFFFDVIKNSKVKKIIDVGCGAGLNAKIFSEKGFDVSSIDVSENAINAAKNQYTGLSFAVAGADSIPFPEKSFDAIYCTEVIEHVDNLGKR